MKKKVIIIVSVVIAIIVAVIAIGALIWGVQSFIQQVQTKEPPTVEQFRSLAEENDYGIYDAKEQYEVYKYIQSALIAIKAGDSHQIEFYEFADSSYARNFYNNNRAIFENAKDSGSVETSIDVSNYAKYVLKTNGKYKVVAIIGNTGIYIDTDEAYENDVNNIITELGY